MAAHLRGMHPPPGIVLCSTANRARETCDLILEGLGLSVRVQLEDDLYGATGAGLLGLLQRLPEAAQAALVLGHNPAVWDLAVQLAGDGPPGTLTRLREKFPTAAVAILTTGDTWAGLHTGSAYLEGFVVPRELEE